MTGKWAVAWEGTASISDSISQATGGGSMSK